MKIIDSIPVIYFSESSIIISRPIIIALFTIGCSKSIAKYSMNSEQQSEVIRPRTNSNGNKSKAYYVNDQFVKSLYNQDLYQVKKSSDKAQMSMQSFINVTQVILPTRRLHLQQKRVG